MKKMLLKILQKALSSIIWALGKVLSVVDGIVFFILIGSEGVVIGHIIMLIIIVLANTSALDYLNTYYIIWLHDSIKACSAWLQSNYVEALQAWAKIWADQHPEWTDLFNETWNWDDLENPITFMSILTLDLIICYILLRCVYRCWKFIMSFLDVG